MAESDRDRLMQARTRALVSLQHACAPGQRAMLEETIAELDRQLTALITPTTTR